MSPGLNTHCDDESQMSSSGNVCVAYLDTSPGLGCIVWLIWNDSLGIFVQGPLNASPAQQDLTSGEHRRPSAKLEKEPPRSCYSSPFAPIPRSYEHLYTHALCATSHAWFSNFKPSCKAWTVPHFHCILKENGEALESFCRNVSIKGVMKGV